MNKKGQKAGEVEGSEERSWLPYIVAVILLLIGSIVLWILRKRGCICCPNGPGTETTIILPEEGAPFSQGQVGDYKIWSQATKGITVTVHKDEVEANRVVELDWGTPTIGPSTDQFELNRPVINFEVQNASGVEVGSFTKPVRLYWAFTEGDLSFAGGYNKLAFAFLNTESKWVEFKRDKHGYTLLRILDHTTPEGEYRLSRMADVTTPEEEEFQIWNWENGWVSLERDKGPYYIGGEEVDKAQIEYAYKGISSYPGMIGFAFAHVSEWGDRHIGGGRKEPGG